MFCKSPILLMLIIYLLDHVSAKGTVTKKKDKSTNIIDYKTCDTSPEKIPFSFSRIETARLPNVKKTFDKIKLRASGTFLFLGGSITAGGYFAQFIDNFHLNNVNISAINYGHGASDVTYFVYCVDIDSIHPDIVFMDFKINDPDSTSMLETLMRKVLLMNGDLENAPLVVIVNFARRNDDCSSTVYAEDLSKHYGLPIIDFCLFIIHCFASSDDSRWSQYSQDYLHPTGPKASFFITSLLTSWWNKMNPLTNNPTTLKPIGKTDILPKRLYPNYSRGKYQYCECLNENSRYGLYPVEVHGFRVKTRTKVGKLSFQSVKRCWEADAPGSSISFTFHGTNLIVVVYEKSVGKLNVFMDNESKPSKTISLYFAGFDWARDKTQGRQNEVMLYGNLSDKQHNVTFVVSKHPANKRHPGHNVQIIALLYSTDEKYLPTTPSKDITDMLL